MCPSLIQIGSKTAEKNCTNKQTDRQTNKQTQTNRHYENKGHLAVNQKSRYSTKRRINTLIVVTNKCKSNTMYIVHRFTITRTVSSELQRFLFYVNFLTFFVFFYLVPCARLSWLSVSSSAHVKYFLTCLIVLKYHQEI